MTYDETQSCSIIVNEHFLVVARYYWFLDGHLGSVNRKAYLEFSRAPGRTSKMEVATDGHYLMEPWRESGDDRRPLKSDSQFMSSLRRGTVIFGVS